MDIPTGPDLSNVEKWLRYITTGEGEPSEILLSDVEKYLAVIATGEGSEILPPPDTRVEEWLAYIVEHGGGGDITVEALSVAENGTYTAPSGKAYSPVEVNVSGGGTAVVEHGVHFIDYDGSIVTAWDSSEVAAKTALPDNPTHDRLVAQGWNWDLQHIKDYVANYPNALVTVGQMYKTASGLTEIDITVTKVTGLSVTCKMSGNKDWGDGTTNSSTSHTYVDYGDYTITCDGASIPSGSVSTGGMFGQSDSNMNRFWCTAVYIGENVTSINNYAFINCYSLTSITIPQGVILINSYTFRGCLSLTSITIPQGITRINNYTFTDCYSLTSITIPQGVTSINEDAFYHCRSLTSITIPQGVTSISNYTFADCYSLTSITIPQGVTSIGERVFYDCYSLTSITIPQGVTSIGNYTFANCYSLTSITIPQGVTSISNNTFYGCFSIIEYDFTAAATVPTLNNIYVFYSINGICKILVPDTLYNDWIVATNWATFADYIYKASEVAA